MALIRFLFWHGRGRGFSDCYQVAVAMDAAHGARVCPGATHAGSRLGGAITPVLVVLIIVRYGWRAAFVVVVCWIDLGCRLVLVLPDTPDEHPSSMRRNAS